jgi:hypothetical protein
VLFRSLSPLEQKEAIAKFYRISNNVSPNFTTGSGANLAMRNNQSAAINDIYTYVSKLDYKSPVDKVISDAFRGYLNPIVGKEVRALNKIMSVSKANRGLSKGTLKKAIEYIIIYKLFSNLVNKAGSAVGGGE